MNKSPKSTPISPLALYVAQEELKAAQEKLNADTKSLLFGTLIKMLCDLAKDSNSAGDEVIGSFTEEVGMLKSAVEEEKDPAMAALIAFRIAAKLGPAAKKMTKRHNLMGIEIDRIIKEIEEDGQKATPAVVWSKLVARRGQLDCSWLTDATSNSDGVSILVWWGPTGNREELTFSSLKSRLRRKRR